MNKVLLATLLSLGLGLGNLALASTPAQIDQSLDQNLVSNETMDSLLTEARQDTQLLAWRGDRRGGYRDHGYRDYGYRHHRHGYRDGYYPRHRGYDYRYNRPRYDYGYRRHHRHYRW